MLDQYGDEEDKANSVNILNYFDVFNKINDKSIKANKGLKVRTSEITITNLPIIEMDEESQKQMTIFEDLISKFTVLIERSGRSKNTCCRVSCYFLLCCNGSCCRCSRFYKKNVGCCTKKQNSGMLFGDLYQSILIMEKNFEGK